MPGEGFPKFNDVPMRAVDPGERRFPLEGRISKLEQRIAELEEQLAVQIQNHQELFNSHQQLTIDLFGGPER
jgi:hypothetical protein